MLWTKSAHQCAIFRLLGALRKVHTIPHTIFETTRSGFIQILHHCSVSWKITPLYFCCSNQVYFGQKEPIENKFSDVWVVGWKLIKFLISYLKPWGSFENFECSGLNSPNCCHLWNHKWVFFSNFASLFSVMRDNFLAEILYDLDRRNPSKCKISDFRLLMWNLGSFCWKYMKFQPKRIEELCLMTLKKDAKIFKKLICCFKNDKNLVNFDLSSWNSQNFDFDWFLLWKVCNVWSKKA